MRVSCPFGNFAIDCLIAACVGILVSGSRLEPVCAEPPPTTSERSLATAAIEILPKRELVKARLGTNAFVNDPRFGSIRSQFREVKNTLGLRHVRVLFHWGEDLQSAPGRPINFSFNDEIIKGIPSGVDALVVLTGVPSWMSDPRNWVGGDPRRTFVEQWVRPVAERYGKKRRISAFQIWNEPNMEANPNNVILDLADNPELYVKMLADAAAEIRKVSPRKLIVSAATTAVNQNYPDTINYNEDLLAAGLEDHVDVVAMHYYGTHLENVYRPGGILDLLEGVSKPIWITESGEQGVNDQLDYAQRIWPFIFSLSPSITRLYQYQFTEGSPSDSTWGLRNLTPGQNVSDLYSYLRTKRRR